MDHSYFFSQTSLTNVEVIAAGLSAWGTIPQYFYLLKDGLKLQPDLVLLVFNLTDPSDNYHFHKYLTSEGKQLLTASSSSQPLVLNTQLFQLPQMESGQENYSLILKTKIFLDNQSMIYHFLRLRFKKLINKQAIISPGSLENDLFSITRVPQPPHYNQFLTETQNMFKKINNTLNNREIDFALILLPHGHNVNDREWDSGRTVWGFTRNKTYSNSVFKDLKHWGNKENINTYDLTPYLQIASFTDRLYYNFDGHLNKKGNEVTAQILFDLLYPQLEAQI